MASKKSAKDAAINSNNHDSNGDRPAPLYGGRRATRYRNPTPTPSNPLNRRSHPVSFTHDDLDRIEARFDAETSGSCWCGYGTWHDAHPSRVVLYRADDESLRLTLTRLSHGTYDLSSDAGAPIACNVSLDEAIDRVVL